MILGYGHTALSMSESAQREALAEADEVWMEKSSLRIAFFRREQARLMLRQARPGDTLLIIQPTVLIPRAARHAAQGLQRLLKHLGRYRLRVRYAVLDYEWVKCPLLHQKKERPDFVSSLVKTLGEQAQREMEKAWCVWYEHHGPQVIGAFTDKTAAQKCLARHPYAKLTLGHPWMQ